MPAKKHLARPGGLPPSVAQSESAARLEFWLSATVLVKRVIEVLDIFIEQEKE